MFKDHNEIKQKTKSIKERQLEKPQMFGNLVLF